MLLNATWGPQGLEMVGALNFSVRFPCQLGARFPIIFRPEFGVLRKMPSKRYLGRFRHLFAPFVLAAGTILVPFWLNCTPILATFQAPRTYVVNHSAGCWWHHSVTIFSRCFMGNLKTLPKICSCTLGPLLAQLCADVGDFCGSQNLFGKPCSRLLVALFFDKFFAMFSGQF